MEYPYFFKRGFKVASVFIIEVILHKKMKSVFGACHNPNSSAPRHGDRAIGEGVHGLQSFLFNHPIGTPFFTMNS